MELDGFLWISVKEHGKLAKANALAEREMAKLCAEDNIAMTPYSALVGVMAQNTKNLNCCGK